MAPVTVSPALAVTSPAVTVSPAPKVGVPLKLAAPANVVNVPVVAAKVDIPEIAVQVTACKAEVPAVTVKPVATVNVPVRLAVAERVWPLMAPENVPVVPVIAVALSVEENTPVVAVKAWTAVVPALTVHPAPAVHPPVKVWVIE